MDEMVAPDQPCPGCGGTLYRRAIHSGDLAYISAGGPAPGKVTRCSGRCELADGIAGVIAAPGVRGRRF